MTSKDFERLTRGLALIATQARACAEARYQQSQGGGLWTSIRNEAAEALVGACFKLGHPIVDACDLVLAEENVFVCRTCESCWIKIGEGLWASTDWSGKFPWELG